MRRFLLLAIVAVATLFNSCQNENITVRRAIDLKINLETIIEPFTYEELDGELSKPYADYELRTQTLIYDIDGDLVESYTDYSDSYNAIIKRSLSLGNGTYRIVVINDVINRTPGDESHYWDIKNVSNLNNLTLIPSDEYWVSRSATLGLACQEINISDNLNGALEINVEPAGALLLFNVKNAHKYDDIDYTVFRSSTIGKSILFDKSGEIIYQKEVADAGRTNALSLIPPGSEGKIVYGYLFLMPIGETDIDFRAISTSGEVLYDSEVLRVNLKKGDEWRFALDYRDETTGETTLRCELMNGDDNTRGTLPAIDSDNIVEMGNTFQELGPKEYRVLDLI
ncbi:MAG: hypothetical protein IKB15_01450 [Alistipes sp.]|nr:hypothetical protein [Alistipes sp.]